jgi:kinesin family protein 3/17
MASAQTQNVIVCVRCRPFSEREKERGSGAQKCVFINTETGLVTLQSIKNGDENKQFTFDAAFDETCKQVC